MDSAIACPTPESLGTNYNIYSLKVSDHLRHREPLCIRFLYPMGFSRKSSQQHHRAISAPGTIWLPAYSVRLSKVCKDCPIHRASIPKSAACPPSSWLTCSRGHPFIQAIRIRQDPRIPRYTTTQQGPCSKDPRQSLPSLPPPRLQRRRSTFAKNCLPAVVTRGLRCHILETELTWDL
jgi:hypothetical protein